MIAAQALAGRKGGLQHQEVDMHQFVLRGTLASLFAAAALGLAGPAQAAGIVEVKWVEPDKFLDIGLGSMERQRNQQELELVFQQMARQLPGGQTLKIEVLDVDLAGETRLGAARDVRIVRGGVDWPRMTLRYSLQAHEGVLKSGEARLADMNYLFGTRAVNPGEGNLPYERRMMLRWFEDTFAPATP